MSSSETSFYRLGHLSVVDIGGQDAAKIINNLTTNEVVGLDCGQGRETFVTDVRGKTVGHVCLYRQSECFRLIGAPGQSEKILPHVDRYTIREDATPVSRDADFSTVVIAEAAASQAGIEPALNDEPIGGGVVRLGDVEREAYRTRWLGEQTLTLLIPVTEIDSVVESLSELHLAPAGEAEFHAARIKVGFPWYGIDLDDSNLPQELDRDREAISFTKGCYLGQETVARLDALGQVQRKLVRWSIQGSIPESGAILSAGDKAVGRLTSVLALSENEAIALGFARRSHFEAGATASGSDSDSGADFTATVL